MKTKAQLSVFFAVALLLLAVVVISSSLDQGKFPVLSTVVDSETLELKQYVETCLRDATEKSIYTVMFQGGYADPVDGVHILETTFPYYWYPDQIAMPTLEDVEYELSFAIMKGFPDCLNNLEDLASSGYSIAYNPSRDPSAELINADGGIYIQYIPSIAHITQEGVISKIVYPLDVSFQGKHIMLDEFIAKVEIDLVTPFSHAQEILNKQLSDPGFFPLGFISDLAHRKEFQFEFLQLQNQVVLSLFYPTKQNQQLAYSFAFNYEEPVLDIEPALIEYDYLDRESEEAANTEEILFG